MSRRAVTFTKPEEPSFLRKLKETINYKEGPTVETKREQLQAATEEDLLDTAEEQPTIVVLESGDLTAEEAAQARNELEKEAEEKPADLSAPIVFKVPTNRKSSKRTQPEDSKEKKSSKKLKNRSLLSFDEEEDE